MPASTTVATPTEESVNVFRIEKEERIAAPIELVFDAILAEMGPEGKLEDGSSMNWKVEPWPGGRWWRDLGNGAGHLWGHIQVIKPPTLLEVTGPMFMSYPAVNFVRYRLASEGASATKLTFQHRGMGLIPREDSDGVKEGWSEILGNIRRLAEAKHTSKKGGSR